MKNFHSTTFEVFGNQLYDDDPLEGNCMDLVKLLLKNYFKLQIHYETVKNSFSSGMNKFLYIYIYLFYLFFNFHVKKNHDSISVIFFKCQIEFLEL